MKLLGPVREWNGFDRVIGDWASDGEVVLVFLLSLSLSPVYNFHIGGHSE